MPPPTAPPPLDPPVLPPPVLPPPLLPPSSGGVTSQTSSSSLTAVNAGSAPVVVRLSMIQPNAPVSSSDATLKRTRTLWPATRVPKSSVSVTTPPLEPV